MLSVACATLVLSNAISSANGVSKHSAVSKTQFCVHPRPLERGELIVGCELKTAD